MTPINHTARVIVFLLVLAALANAAQGQLAESDRRTLIERLDKRAEHCAALSKQIWEWAEVGYQETKSAALLKEIEKWLLEKGHDTRSVDLRSYLAQWRKALKEDAFALEAPGRWKYFLHLLGYPWTYGEIMTGRHRVYSYMRASAALVLGYDHLYLFDDARRKRKEWMAPSSNKAIMTVNAKAKAAATRG